LVDRHLTIKLETIDRPSVRALTEGYHQRLGAAAVAGRNIHQMSLAWQNALNSYMATLSPEDVLLFSRLYKEETSSLLQAPSANTTEMHSQTAAQRMQARINTSQVVTWISLIVFFIILITMTRIPKGSLVIIG
jgi:hypothetical protein